jgi:hypothetical protein
MQAFQEQQYNSGGLRNRAGAGGPQEGTYASAAQTQTPATLNRFHRTRMEEEGSGVDFGGGGGEPRHVARSFRVAVGCADE